MSMMKAPTLLATFVALQIADGFLTLCGIDRFGTAAEANPLIALGFTVMGPGAALVVAKLVAIGSALLLCHLSRYTLLAGLTLGYFVVAVLPWVVALTVTF
jgi:hypothetical protein